MPADTIEVVEFVMKHNLPDCWLPLEATLSLIGSCMLEDVDHCIGLILVGEPGGRKSTTLELPGKSDPIFREDVFTPASFVSHDASKKEEQLRKIDLLPQLKHKILVVPELAPMFGQRYEDLVKDIAILTTVMDGRGFLSHSGVHGKRGYEGDHCFGMLAGTTPLPHRAWDALGKLSSRWIFYRLEEATGEFIDLREDFTAKKVVCREVVGEFMTNFWQGSGTVSWDRQQDAEVWLQLLQWSARAMSKWRGLVQRDDATGYNPPVIENPARLAETLYALARGHALLWGRTQLTWDDVCFVIYLNETNMPEDRLRVFRALDDAYTKHIQNGGDAQDLFDVGISLRAAARALKSSTEKAQRVLSELEDLGAIQKKEVTEEEVTVRSGQNVVYCRNI